MKQTPLLGEQGKQLLRDSVAGRRFELVVGGRAPPRRPGVSSSAEGTVIVPDGVFAGQDFTVEHEGEQLPVRCPDGSGPGDAINLDRNVILA